MQNHPEENSDTEGSCAPLSQCSLSLTVMSREVQTIYVSLETVSLKLYNPCLFSKFQFAYPVLIANFEAVSSSISTNLTSRLGET